MWVSAGASKVNKEHLRFYFDQVRKDGQDLHPTHGQWERWGTLTLKACALPPEKFSLAFQTIEAILDQALAGEVTGKPGRNQPNAASLLYKESQAKNS